MERRLYFRLSEDFVNRLLNVAQAERRDARIQATVCLEMGIALLEKQYGLSGAEEAPLVIGYGPEDIEGQFAAHPFP